MHLVREWAKELNSEHLIAGLNLRKHADKMKAYKLLQDEQDRQDDNSEITIDESEFTGCPPTEDTVRRIASEMVQEEMGKHLYTDSTTAVSFPKRKPAPRRINRRAARFCSYLAA